MPVCSEFPRVVLIPDESWNRFQAGFLARETGSGLRTETVPQPARRIALRHSGSLQLQMHQARHGVLRRRDADISNRFNSWQDQMA